MELLFVKSESTFSSEATRRYIDKHGKPLALYSDKAGVFRVNNKHATGGDGHTQFGRAMHELNIQTICAETSPAKGRVERAHLTLQDRLVKERGYRAFVQWRLQMTSLRPIWLTITAVLAKYRDMILTYTVL
ncbi:Putative transposase (identified by ISEscan HMM) [Escherichia coli]|nr:Putative transposase (identified by ISEscan HMM) [Escherichia coli]